MRAWSAPEVPVLTDAFGFEADPILSVIRQPGDDDTISVDQHEHAALGKLALAKMLVEPAQVETGD